MGESAYSNADSKDAAIYAADLRRIVNGWRITQHRRTKRADRAPVTPTYDDPVNDGLVRVDHPILDTTLTELRQRWAPCPVAVPGGSEHCPATRPYDPDEDYGDELDEEGLDADDFESPEEVEERRAAGECVCDGLLSIPCPRCDGLGPRDGEL